MLWNTEEAIGLTRSSAAIRRTTATMPVNAAISARTETADRLAPRAVRANAAPVAGIVVTRLATRTIGVVAAVAKHAGVVTTHLVSGAVAILAAVSGHASAAATNLAATGITFTSHGA